MKFFILVIQFLSISCRHLNQPSISSPVTEEKKVVEPIQQNPDEEILSSEDTTSEEENEIFTEILDELCKDDIYTNYLKEKFISENNKIKKRSRKNLERMELDALSYARIRMEGPNAPYYGAIPVVVNIHVEMWLKYFKTRGRQDFMKWMVREKMMKKVVEPLLADEGLPLEFFYLAMIESGLSNSAYSRAKATGTWQFMKGTGTRYGLKINYWVDERRDPLKSTIAAARFLRDLYAQFGDWYLAIAAYNAGPGKVKRAIQKTRSMDFWKLCDTKFLRAETKHYIPKMLAALLIASNPEGHGFDTMENPIEEFPDAVLALERPLVLDEIAKELGVPLSTVKKWNPELIRHITPPIKLGENYPLRIPSFYIATLEKSIPTFSEVKIKDIHLHPIAKGDTLSRVAKKYGVSIREILQMNPSINPKSLRVGKEVAIPVPGIVKITKSNSENINL